MRFTKYLFLLIVYCTSINMIYAQQSSKQTYTKADTLRGAITAERIWWDVVHYDITIKPDITNKSVQGSNTVTFKPTSHYRGTDKAGSIMQIDLQQPMRIDSAIFQSSSLPFTREGNVYYITFKDSLPLNNSQKLILYFSGQPQEAVNPPWDGGWIWSRDDKKNPWVTVACQGKGASVWFPNKDHQSDEVDSAALTIVVPDSLTGIGNGRLTSKITDQHGYTHYRWIVTNPINNYNIIPYIGKYVNFTEVYEGENGHLDCSYWVMDYNLEKAKKHFQQVIPMMKCLEHWFGPYPFYEDSYKLVESPHMGMEHQSGVAYGNKYFNGYRGTDLSHSGWGLKFDFIIVHETGHEWFGNNITTKDIADMWVHESFTSYSETLHTNCLFGDSAANKYVQGTRKNIMNDVPIIGAYNVNKKGSGDMYYKGANMLHTIRQIVNDDEKFRQMLRGLNQTFYHQTVTSEMVENYMIKFTGLELQKIFDQYLRTTKIPILEYKQSQKGIQYRWANTIEGFNMPVKVNTGSSKWINPTSKWQTLTVKTKSASAPFAVDANFYITTKRIK